MGPKRKRKGEQGLTHPKTRKQRPAGEKAALWGAMARSPRQRKRGEARREKPGGGSKKGENRAGEKAGMGEKRGTRPRTREKGGGGEGAQGKKQGGEAAEREKGGDLAPLIAPGGMRGLLGESEEGKKGGGCGGKIPLSLNPGAGCGPKGGALGAGGGAGGR